MLKFLFWLGVFALIAYFAIGESLAARSDIAVLISEKACCITISNTRLEDGISCLKDFWREFPLLISDLFGHLFAGLRGTGGGGRGGYSSLG